MRKIALFTLLTLFGANSVFAAGYVQNANTPVYWSRQAILTTVYETLVSSDMFDYSLEQILESRDMGPYEKAMRKRGDLQNAIHAINITMYNQNYTVSFNQACDIYTTAAKKYGLTPKKCSEFGKILLNNHNEIAKNGAVYVGNEEFGRVLREFDCAPVYVATGIKNIADCIDKEKVFRPECFTSSYVFDSNSGMCYLYSYI